MFQSTKTKKNPTVALLAHGVDRSPEKLSIMAIKEEIINGFIVA
jgi:hypothetical protein